MEQLVHFPTREKNTLDLIITSLPSQFLDIQSPDRLSDHDIVSGTLKIVIPPIKKPRRKVYRYQKGDYESMRSDALKFAKERYFNGYSDTRSVQEDFNLITSFIQDSADKHIPSKTSRSVSSVPWITPAIRRKIRRKNATHAKAKKSGSAKIRAKFETLRREIKADIRKQHDLYVNNLVGDVKTNPKDFYRYINSQKKDAQGIPPLKKRNGGGVAQSESEKAAEFNGQFTDVFTKSEYSQVPLLDRSASFMEYIVVTKEGVSKLLKGLNPSKALGSDELHPRVLKELATALGPICTHLFQQSIDSGDNPKEWTLANISLLFQKGDRSLACNYRVDNIKYLGVTITNDLKWNTHISNICTKANRTLGFLRRTLFSCPQNVKEAAYKGMVRPILEYGSSVWDPHPDKLQEELEKVQNRAARFVTRNYIYETGSMTGILGQLKWESLKKRRKDNRLIMLYKGLKGKARIPTDDLIPKTRRGRNQHSLAFQIPSASKDVYQYNFFPQTIRDWNDLPESLISTSELPDDSVSCSPLL